MKKISVLAVILVLATVMTACGADAPQETTAATTVPPTTAATTAPVETTVPQPPELVDWTMYSTTWSSPNGATVHISATPSTYAEGHKADFVVRLEGDEIFSTPCTWDGTVYTAQADLNAANGYCYYIILTDTDGTALEFAVNTPTEPVDEVLINLEAALESYCGITVEDSGFDSNKLTLNSGSVQIKLPTITDNGTAITCQEAALVLSHNGQQLHKQVLTVTEPDASGLCEFAVSDVSFELPELENQQKVELMLTVTLSNQQVLSAYGGDWVFSADALLPVVG